MDTLVQLDSVCYQSGEQAILENVSLGVKSGQIVSLIGPNGAGKSTLVKIVLGLLSPTQGSVKRQNDLRIGYMPQNMPLGELLPMTIRRFLCLVPQVTRKKVAACLDELNIDYLANRQLAALSGGEWQRVLLARALLNEPNLLVLDEPTQGMDVQGQADFFALIANIRQARGCAVLLVSHDLHYVMAATDEVLCLNSHICCHGHPDVVQNSPEYLALYRHQHDHQHDLQGNVIQE